MHSRRWVIGKSEKALASLACGIASLIIGDLGSMFISVVAHVSLGLIAIALGVIARNEIKTDPNLEGLRTAEAGIITGAITPVLLVVGVIGLVIGDDELVNKLVSGVFMVVLIVVLIAVVLWFLYYGFVDPFLDD